MHFQPVSVGTNLVAIGLPQKAFGFCPLLGFVKMLPIGIKGKTRRVVRSRGRKPGPFMSRGRIVFKASISLNIDFGKPFGGSCFLLLV